MTHARDLLRQLAVRLGIPRLGTGVSAITTVNTFLEGTMVVDVFDARTERLIWRGIASETVSDDPQKNAKKIGNAVEKMFKRHFPPATKAT
jgi:hypothetical protein